MMELAYFMALHVALVALANLSRDHLNLADSVTKQTFQKLIFSTDSHHATSDWIHTN